MNSKGLNLLFVVFISICAFCYALITEPLDETCKTRLNTCDVESKFYISGTPGATGDTGPKGDKGQCGRNGTPGTNGAKGHDGAPGLKGEPGPGCEDGAKGDAGPRGPEGFPGEQGKEGRQGLKGERGDLGIPGSPGVCTSYSSEPITASEGSKPWATKENPGMVTCKNAPIDLEDTYYYLRDGIQVKCDAVTKLTCVSYSSLTKIHYNETEPFWLSQKNITIKDIYGLESDQIGWLQRNSFVANLTIRFHCLNSKPVGSDAMKLLTWNDVKVGPKPTATTSFHYYVLNDGCSDAPKNKWNHTDVVLLSPIAQRLPIIDFFIRDVRNEDQDLHIEIMHLCFG